MERLINRTRGGREIAVQVERADTFWRRGVGLLGRAGLPAGAVLWIAPCRSIHMFGMRFALDLLFLDADLRVVNIVRNIRPWQMASGGAGAHSVVELATGWLPDEAAAPGDQLAWAPRRTSNATQRTSNNEHPTSNIEGRNKAIANSEVKTTEGLGATMVSAWQRPGGT